MVYSIFSILEIPKLDNVEEEEVEDDVATWRRDRENQTSIRNEQQQVMNEMRAKSSQMMDGSQDMSNEQQQARNKFQLTSRIV
jgi:transketolase